MTKMENIFRSLSHLCRCVVIHNILYLTSLFICLDLFHGVDGSPVYQFQYQCYATDICFFPGQYCDSKLERCSPCAGKCGKEKGTLPLGCQTFCAKGKDESFGEDSSAWIESEWWFYVSVALFAILCVLLVGKAIHYTRNRRRSKVTDGQEETQPMMHDKGTGDKADSESGLDSMSSSEDVLSQCKGIEAYCEKKLKNVPPTRTGTDHTQTGTTAVATSLSTATTKADVLELKRKLKDASVYVPVSTDSHSPPRITTSASVWKSSYQRIPNDSSMDVSSVAKTETRSEDQSSDTNQKYPSVQSLNEEVSTDIPHTTSQNSTETEMGTFTDEEETLTDNSFTASQLTTETESGTFTDVEEALTDNSDTSSQFTTETESGTFTEKKEALLVTDNFDATSSQITSERESGTFTGGGQ